MTLDLTAEQLLTTTRAVRKRLDFERPVEREVVERCVELALQAPTGSNRQGWHFVFVDDPGKKRALADLYGRGFDPYAATPGPTYEDGDPRAQRGEFVRGSAVYLREHFHEVPVMLVPVIEGRLPEDRSPVFAQAERDETAVIKAGLKYTTNSMFPYVANWVLNPTTLPLEAGMSDSWFDPARADYASRNETTTKVAGTDLARSGVVFPDPRGTILLSEVGEGALFDWESFVNQFSESSTYAMRISRPGFSDDAHAVVRYDVADGMHDRWITCALSLARIDGRWTVERAQHPAVPPD